jgi:hypothetical protein
MKIFIQDGLPFVTGVLIYRGKRLILENLLLDTGSASTILSTDQVQKVGLVPRPEDPLHEIRGVGGVEIVFSRKVDYLVVGEFVVESFDVEIGAMEYGIAIDGIIGLDFLTQMKAVLDFDRFEIVRARSEL